MAQTCESHPDREAAYVCDGCQKLLCQDCIEEGHRLLFCIHCGEMAIPLATGAPTSTTELARERKVTAEYSLGEALTYPFRGLGLFLFVGYVLLVMGLDLAAAIPGLGCAMLVVQLLILLILPGFLFAIVRTSAEGDTELPDWPDFSEYGERFGEWFAFMLIVAMAAVPTLALPYLAGCDALSLFNFGLDHMDQLGVAGFLLEKALCVALGLTVGVMLWTLGVGAVGTYGSGWLGWRADLHVRALVNVWDDAFQTIGLLAGLWLVSLIIRVGLSFLPIMGAIVSIAVGTYTLFVGAHLIGLLFRRNTKTLESIYLGR